MQYLSCYENSLAHVTHQLVNLYHLTLCAEKPEKNFGIVMGMWEVAEAQQSKNGLMPTGHHGITGHLRTVSVLIPVSIS